MRVSCLLLSFQKREQNTLLLRSKNKALKPNLQTCFQSARPVSDTDQGFISPNQQTVNGLNRKVSGSFFIKSTESKLYPEEPRPDRLTILNFAATGHSPLILLKVCDIHGALLQSRSSLSQYSFECSSTMFSTSDQCRKTCKPGHFRCRRAPTPRADFNVTLCS